jgi:hypothetical protein
MLAAGSVILTVVFADQTLATVLEATRIRTAIGPSQAWYTENLRYYYLILPTVDGSLSRRFGFLITALCLFTAVFIMLRRKRVRGVARGPAWRLMGVIFGTMFRITPDYTAKKMDTDIWEDGVNGGLLGITDLLLRAHVMATYLSRDWARDWGSLRRFDTLVDAPPADLDQGTATHFGWWSPGQIRIKP